LYAQNNQALEIMSQEPIAKSHRKCAPTPLVFNGSYVESKVMTFGRSKEVENRNAARAEDRKQSDERNHEAFVATIKQARADEEAANTAGTTVKVIMLNRHKVRKPHHERESVEYIPEAREPKRQRRVEERRFVEFGTTLPGEQYHARCRDPECRLGDGRRLGSSCPCGQNVSYWAEI
jgi:hypothetical protein